MDEYQKLAKTLRNLKKIADFIKNILKFETLKYLKKTIPLLLETMQCPINKPQIRLPGP